MRRMPVPEVNIERLEFLFKRCHAVDHDLILAQKEESPSRESRWWGFQAFAMWVLKTESRQQAAGLPFPPKARPHSLIIGAAQKPGETLTNATSHCNHPRIGVQQNQAGSRRELSTHTPAQTARA